MKKNAFIIIVIGLLLLGCVSTRQQVLNSWVGSTKQRLILSWGPPTSVSDDGNGGEVLIYDKRVNTGTTTRGTAYINSDNTVDYNTRTYGGVITRRYMMYVDKDEKIYHWRYITL